MPFESWEMDNAGGKLRKAILVLLMVGILAGTAYGAYKITSPPSAPITVNTQATLTAPTYNATGSIVVGDVLTLSSTLSSQMPGIQVFFYSNQTTIPLGSGITDSNGVAIYNALMSTPNTYVFTADSVHP